MDRPPAGPPGHAMRFKWEWVVKGLVESIFVVGSILVALAVDEWAENRDFAELADLSLGIFAQEIAQNRARLEDGLPYHEGIRDLLGQMRQASGASADLRSIMEGLEAPVLLNTAWETALATGALTHMDFEVVRALSLTYSIQEGFAVRTRLERPRFATSASVDPAVLREQLDEAYDYVAALARDEAELMTVFDQALGTIRGSTGPGSTGPVEESEAGTRP